MEDTTSIVMLPYKPAPSPPAYMDYKVIVLRLRKAVINLNLQLFSSDNDDLVAVPDKTLQIPGIQTHPRRPRRLSLSKRSVSRVNSSLTAISVSVHSMSTAMENHERKNKNGKTGSVKTVSSIYSTAC